MSGVAALAACSLSLCRRFSFCLISSIETKGIVAPSGALTNTLVGNAPLLVIFRYWVLCSPKMTLPKSILGVSTSISAFLHVQMSGMSMRPVSLRMGKTELMS